MKAVLLAAISLIHFSFVGIQTNTRIENRNVSHTERLKKERIVYICNGPDSYAYHAHPSCGGLNNCSTQIYKVSQSEAVNKGRRACRRCY